MSDVLVWTDVETTGLIPGRDVVLEVGMIATDWELNPIDGVKPLHLVTHLDAVDLESMGGVAFGMHERNGLLDECVASSLRAVDASRRVAAWLEALRAGPVVLAGSSVHFDRGFLRAMAGNFKPDPLGGISHRLMDVSVLDMLAEHLYPDVYAHRPERTTNHRVMACLNDSMALYRYYREHLLPSDSMAADVWDEGYTTGVSDGLHNMRNTNPYRKEEA